MLKFEVGRGSLLKKPKEFFSSLVEEAVISG